jgi:hypothetical protein
MKKYFRKIGVFVAGMLVGVVAAAVMLSAYFERHNCWMSAIRTGSLIETALDIERTGEYLPTVIAFKHVLNVIEAPGRCSEIEIYHRGLAEYDRPLFYARLFVLQEENVNAQAAQRAYEKASELMKDREGVRSKEDLRKFVHNLRNIQ